MRAAREAEAKVQATARKEAELDSWIDAHPDFAADDAMQAEIAELIQRMQHTSFDPAVAGLVALGALRTDVPREKPEDIIKDLEDVLAQTKTLGLRNSIRMMLKDLYRDQDKHAKVLEHLKAVIAENDAALQEEKKLEASKAAKTK